MRFITKTILCLSLVSLFTDVASEMLYPIMPMYLRSIGFSVLLIGILEGVAEATAGLSKGYFGKLSDHLGRRRPFVQIGYSLSAISKPMMAILIHPLWIFTARTTDRLGKGIRTAARDALLSEETTPEFKGRVFGFHRGFDTLGAAIGPAVAIIFLTFHPEEYRTLFLIAFVPGILAVTLTFLVSEKRLKSDAPISRAGSPGFLSFLKYWNVSSREFRLVVAGLLAFAVVNSSDLLLLLMLKNNGASDQHVILAYVGYNLVYALLSYPMGALGDKIGLQQTFLLGLILFAAVYAGVIVVSTLSMMIVLFAVYGLYAAATEGISKAWISNIVPKGETATAIGFLTGMSSICSLLASTVAGAIWYGIGATYAFAYSSVGALMVIFYFFSLPSLRRKSQDAGSS